MKTSTCFMMLVVSAGCVARVQATSTIQFVRSALAIPENWGDAVLVVQRSTDIDAVVSVDYATTDGTAVGGSDYRSSNGTLTFQAGQTNQMLRVPILNDTLPGPQKYSALA
jgi:hypothetical protein